MHVLLFLVKHVHVLGIQVITFALEIVFQRDFLCLVYFTWFMYLCMYLFVYLFLI